MPEGVRRCHAPLRGSFQKTYQGHGTDRALIGGLLGMGVDDTRLRDSLRNQHAPALPSPMALG